MASRMPRQGFPESTEVAIERIPPKRREEKPWQTTHGTETAGALQATGPRLQPTKQLRFPLPGRASRYRREDAAPCSRRPWWRLRCSPRGPATRRTTTVPRARIPRPRRSRRRPWPRARTGSPPPRTWRFQGPNARGTGASSGTLYARPVARRSRWGTADTSSSGSPVSQIRAHCPLEHTDIFYHGFSRGSAQSFPVGEL